MLCCCCCWTVIQKLFIWSVQHQHSGLELWDRFTSCLTRLLFWFPVTVSSSESFLWSHMVFHERTSSSFSSPSSAPSSFSLYLLCLPLAVLQGFSPCRIDARVHSRTPWHHDWVWSEGKLSAREGSKALHLNVTLKHWKLGGGWMGMLLISQLLPTVSWTKFFSCLNLTKPLPQMW